MRSIFTTLMVLFALSASAQINNSQEVTPQDSVAVAATPAVATPDSLAVVSTPATATSDSLAVAVQPEVVKTDSLTVAAEESVTPQPVGRATVNITTHGDAGAIINKTLYNGPKKVKGYRIMVYTGSTPSARGEAGAARGRFSRYFSFPTYMFYENPYFKVTAGNFRTIEEAQRQLERVRKYFPKAFIVHEDISVNEFAK